MGYQLLSGKINHSEVRRNQALIFKVVFKPEKAMIDGGRLGEQKSKMNRSNLG